MGRRKEIEELRRNDICETTCCCDSCYPCDNERLAELRKIAEERKAAEQQKAVETKQKPMPNPKPEPEPKPSPKEEIVPTPRECCKTAGVPAFCLGLCAPAGAMARQGNRINACSKYDRIIDGCFLHPYKPEIVPIQEHNAPDPGHCIGNECGGICPPCKSEPIPKKIQNLNQQTVPVEWALVVMMVRLVAMVCVKQTVDPNRCRIDQAF